MYYIPIDLSVKELSNDFLRDSLRPPGKKLIFLGVRLISCQGGPWGSNEGHFRTPHKKLSEPQNIEKIGYPSCQALLAKPRVLENLSLNCF